MTGSGGPAEGAQVGVSVGCAGVGGSADVFDGHAREPSPVGGGLEGLQRPPAVFGGRLVGHAAMMTYRDGIVQWP